MTTDEAITQIHRMSSSELTLAVEAIKLRRTALARGSVRSLRIGDSVRFKNRNGSHQRGVVTKLNRKTAVVDCGAGGSWRVTASLLSAC